MSQFLVTLLLASVAACASEKVENSKVVTASSAADLVTIGATGSNWNGPFPQGLNNYPAVPPSTSYGTPLAPPIGPNGVPTSLINGPVGGGPFGPNNVHRGGFNDYSRNAPAFARYNSLNNNYSNLNGWKTNNYPAAGYVYPGYNTATSYNNAFNPAYNPGFQYPSTFNGQPNSAPYNTAGYNVLPNVRYNNGYTSPGYNDLATNGGYTY